MNWHELARQLEAALVTGFDAFVAAHPGDHLYALALVTEDGAMSVGMAANTEEASAAHLAAEREDDESLLPADAAWARWGIAEWAFEGWRDELFAAPNQALRAAAIEGRIASMPDHLARLVEAMTAALAHLRRERAAALAGVALFVTLTDSDAAEAIEDASARRLNPPELLARFLARFAA